MKFISQLTFIFSFTKLSFSTLIRLLDLFEYLDGIHLLQAFHGLNIRIDNLLFKQFQKYHFDFRSVPKHDVENTCQRYLPSIRNQTIALSLSDDEETPNFLELFLSHGNIINQFTHLRSLSIYNIQSFDIFNQLITQCQDLSYLTHLNMIKC